MAQGTIKWFNEVKGFGFIERGDDEEDLWFHAKDRKRVAVDESQLVQGARVEFEVDSNERGAKGRITRVLNEAEPALPAEDAPLAITLDEAVQGLKQALLAALEWIDVLEQIAKNGQA